MSETEQDFDVSWGHVTFLVLFSFILLLRFLWSIIQHRFHYPKILTSEFWSEMSEIVRAKNKENIRTNSSQLCIEYDNSFNGKLSKISRHLQKNQHVAIQARDPLIFLLNYFFMLSSLSVYTYTLVILLKSANTFVFNTSTVGVIPTTDDAVYYIQVMDCYMHTFIFPIFISLMQIMMLACIIVSATSVMFFKVPDIQKQEAQIEDDGVRDQEFETQMKKDYLSQTDRHETISINVGYRRKNLVRTSSSDNDNSIDEGSAIDHSLLENSNTEEEHIRMPITPDTPIISQRKTWYFVNGFSKATLMAFVFILIVIVASFSIYLPYGVDSCSQNVLYQRGSFYIFGGMLEWWPWIVSTLINASCLVCVIIMFILRRHNQNRRKMRDQRIREQLVENKLNTIQQQTEARHWLRAVYQLDPFDFRYDLLFLWFSSTIYLLYNSPFTHSIHTAIQGVGGVFGALFVNNFLHLIINASIHLVPMFALAMRKRESIQPIQLDTDPFENNELEKHYKLCIVKEETMNTLVANYHQSLKIPMVFELYQEFAQSQNNMLLLVVYLWRWTNNLCHELLELKKDEAYGKLMKEAAEIIAFLERNKCLCYGDKHIDDLRFEINSKVQRYLSLSEKVESGTSGSMEDIELDAKEILQKVGSIVRHNLYHSADYYQDFRDRICCVNFVNATGINTNHQL